LSYELSLSLPDLLKLLILAESIEVIDPGLNLFEVIDPGLNLFEVIDPGMDLLKLSILA
jgi:hypothetical protein